MAPHLETTGAHALVIGASGLAGWGVVNELLKNYPAIGTFSKVTAVVNRPFSVADSCWPTPESPKLDLVPNVNLMEGSVEAFTAIIKEKIGDIANVTHVYYFALKQDDDNLVEVNFNVGMLERVIGALESLCPNLKFLVFPAGARAYGIGLPGGSPFKAPFKESMGRLPAPDCDKVHYFAFEDLLTEKSKGKAWSYCSVSPDAVIGFAPNGSAFNLCAHWANYLSVYRIVEGEGASVPFPGTELAYNSKFNEASSEIIAKFAIWASLHPEKTGEGQTFNIADHARPSTMRERWPLIAAHFGLVGTGPPDPDDILKPGEYIIKHADILKERCKKSNAVFKAEFLDSYGYYLNFDRHLSLDKARAAGFDEEMDPTGSWLKAFDSFKAAGMIPC
ncbi:hypothetical protein C8J57DRAFT_1309612 [Mycena rebaudengoi]|nr:hypothetical protein C8J57DRAFT_1309612 [Mycena rebaudengoi]